MPKQSASAFINGVYSNSSVRLSESGASIFVAWSTSVVLKLKLKVKGVKRKFHAHTSQNLSQR